MIPVVRYITWLAYGACGLVFLSQRKNYLYNVVFDLLLSGFLGCTFFLLFSFLSVCVLEGDKGWDYPQFLWADDFMVQDQLSKQPFLLNRRILNLWAEVIGSGKVILHLKAWGRFSEMLGSVPWHVCGSRYCKAELPQLSLAVSVPMGWWLYAFAVVCMISEESKGVQMAMSEKNGSS